MKITRRIITLPMLLFQVAFSWAQQVQYGESFVLDKPVHPAGADEYRAAQYISLEKGFHADPDSGTSLLLRLSPMDIPSSSANVLAYPNPVEDRLNIGLSVMATDNRGRIRIVDSQGRVCLERPLHGVGDKLSIDVSELPPGIYLYRIEGSGQGLLKGKFVKQ